MASSLLAVLMAPAGLAAHQALRSAAPADGSVLDSVPGEIRLTFSEPVRLEFTEVVVQGHGGLLRLGPPRRAEDNPRVLVVEVEGGWHAGEFALRWVTVGSDGHRTDGTLNFSVIDGAAGLPLPDPEPEEAVEPDEATATPHHDPRLFPETPAFGPGSPAYVAVRLLLFVALVALLGAASLRFLVLPVVAQRWPREASALRPGIDRGTGLVGAAAAAALMVATLGRLGAQSASLFGPDAFLDPGRWAQALQLEPWATGWWLQLGTAGVALLGFALVLAGRGAGWALAAPAAVLAAVTPALSGHAVATPGLAWLAVLADHVHVLAAGGWIGGLFAVVVVGLPTASRLDAGLRAPAASALVHSFSTTALAFTGALVATGLLSAWLHVGEIPALWTTAYGRTLLLKVGIFAAVAVAGAYNFLRVRPALGEADGAARLRRSGAAELILALAVLAVTAVLVAIPPPAE